MGFRFRKSFGKGPFKVTVSKSGVGYSVGSKAFRATKKAGGGTRTTASIPGTGISYSSDSKKKRTSHSTRSHAVSNSVSASSSSTPTSNGGCLKSILWIFLLLIVVCLIIDYWKIFIILGLLCIFAYVGYTVYKDKKTADSAAPGIDAPVEDSAATADTQSIDQLQQPEKSEIQIALESRMDEYDRELQSIPLVEIPLSKPAHRQMLKDMPEYTFSNVTRKTRLDSIFPLVFLDVETTGFAPSKCDIIEISAIKFESGMVPVSAFSTLCKPKHPIPEEAAAVNHITDDMVEDAPTFSQVAPALTDFLKGCHLAGHNLDFDLRFIYVHGTVLPEGVKFYDTLDLAHLTVPKSSIDNYKLDTLCGYYGIWRKGSHRALSDCYATSKVFTNLVFDKTSRQLDASAETTEE